MESGAAPPKEHGQISCELKQEVLGFGELLDISGWLRCGSLPRPVPPGGGEVDEPWTLERILFYIHCFTVFNVYKCVRYSIN